MPRLLVTLALMPSLALAGAVPRSSSPVWLVSPEGNEANVMNVAPADRERVQILTSNNNLAIKVFGGRLYFAFRSATHHHPKPPIWAPQYLRVSSAITRMYVLSAPITPNLWAQLESEAPKIEWRLELEVNTRLVDHFRSATRLFLTGTPEGKQFFLDTFGKEETDKLVALAGEPRPAPSASDVERFLDDARSVLREFDLREPMFFALDGRLHFYLGQIEGRSMRFNPLRAWSFVLDDKNGKWGPATPVLAPKEHFWDVIVRREKGGEVAYLTSYSGAHYVVNADERDNAVHFRQSRDGYKWTPLSANDAVYRGGASEAAVVFPPGSSQMLAVLRLDDGDQRGWGSLLAQADIKHLGTWKVPARAEPERYDSPRMFTHGNDVYLVARQNLCQGASGKFDEAVNCPFDRAFVGQDEKKAAIARESLFDKISKKILSRKIVAWQESEVMKGDEAAVHKRSEAMLAQIRNSILAGEAKGGAPTDGFNPGLTLQYEYTYHFNLPKRTTLYRLDRKTGRFTPILILPSAGDTAFPSIEKIGEHEFLIANYSSDPKNPNWTWRDGQQNRTGIYLVKLTFSENGEIAKEAKAAPKGR